jgi:hypothetical protein
MSESKILKVKTKNPTRSIIISFVFGSNCDNIVFYQHPAFG